MHKDKVPEEIRVKLCQREILVFVPSYNCAEHIVDTICGIPEELHGRISCLIIDNCSSDGSAERVRKAIEEGRFGFPAELVVNERNLGYAGSQKKAYRMAVDSGGRIRKVIMLHGDGQYPPELMGGFAPYFDGDFALVNGCRDKKAYPDREQTPFSTYLIIKTLDFIESLLTGIKSGEWHSGYVMYDTRFLGKVPLERLGDVMHFDGEMILCAGILGEKIGSIPIYKLYKDRKAFGTLAGIKHVIQVTKTIFKYRLGYYRKIFRDE